MMTIISLISKLYLTHFTVCTTQRVLTECIVQCTSCTVQCTMYSVKVCCQAKLKTLFDV